MIRTTVSAASPLNCADYSVSVEFASIETESAHVRRHAFRVGYHGVVRVENTVTGEKVEFDV